MKTRIILPVMACLVMLGACSKAVENVKDRIGGNAPVNQFVEHLIVKGSHNSNKNSYRPVNTDAMQFVVRFDQSAVYQTVHPDNQRDINKLYGFSDNNEGHHQFSARIGWRWFNNELQLFAYVYNTGVQSDQFITTVPLNQDINCNIRTAGDKYIFVVNGVTVQMPRTAATPAAVGYQLYPYFGGDETAPQDIRIMIKDIR